MHLLGTGTQGWRKKTQISELCARKYTSCTGSCTSRELSSLNRKLELRRQAGIALSSSIVGRESLRYKACSSGKCRPNGEKRLASSLIDRKYTHIRLIISEKSNNKSWKPALVFFRDAATFEVADAPNYYV